MVYKGVSYSNVKFHEPIITQENFKGYITEILENLKDIGIIVETTSKNYELKLNERALSRFGRCSRTKGSNHYIIEINNFHNLICDKEDVINTLIHEVLHSLPKCMNHGEIWKRMAYKYEKAYGVKISRTGSYDKYTVFKKEHEANRNKNNINTSNKETRKNKYKYEITCEGCGHSWKYQKRSKIIELAIIGRKLKCPYCTKGLQNFTVKDLIG